MSSGKRKPQGNIGKQGGSTTKKVKTNEVIPMKLRC